MIHKRNQIKGEKPLCFGDSSPVVLGAYSVSDDIDEVNCVDCLRMLAKDAVRYGRGRRARRQR